MCLKVTLTNRQTSHFVVIEVKMVLDLLKKVIEALDHPEDVTRPHFVTLGL